MVDDCIANLPICNASCCRMLTFTLNICIGHPMETYYKKRGLKVIRKDRNMMTVLVPSVCGQLDTDTNLCRLHASGQKPFVCKDYSRKTAGCDRYYITEGCLYHDPEN